MIVSSQSRNLSFPHRLSASWCLMNVSNAGFVFGRDASVASVAGNDMMNGV